MLIENKPEASSYSKRPIYAFVIDDSAVIRGLFSRVLESDPDIEVVATAENGAIALDILKKEGDERIEVDVITLDIQMPVMDGLEVLPEILKLRPNVRIIMSSTLTKNGASETIKALSMGAADYLTKPAAHEDRSVLYDFSKEILTKVKTLGNTRQRRKILAANNDKNKATAKIAPYNSSEIKLRPEIIKAPEILAIGSSTGGPQALTVFFKGLKGKDVTIPIIITQHMPPEFTTLLAKQIAAISGLPCQEAAAGLPLLAGHVYIAPGDYHMSIKKESSQLFLDINQNPKENYCRPSVDPMFRSAFEIFGDRVLVLMLTGMGSDGFKSTKKIADEGGVVIAQDEATSVVWGMPGAIASAGLCNRVEPLEALAKCTIEMSRGKIR